jgi:hypothetical protein
MHISAQCVCVTPLSNLLLMSRRTLYHILLHSPSLVYQSSQLRFTVYTFDALADRTAGDLPRQRTQPRPRPCSCTEPRPTPAVL